MATISKIEKKLLQKKVQIEQMTGDMAGIKEVTGYYNGRKYKWNRKGLCFKGKTRHPELDIDIDS